MIDETPLESVKSNITVEFENSSQAKIIYDAIILEFETAPDFRSSMTIELDDSNILIVTHHSVFKTLYYLLNNVDFSNKLEDISIDNCAYMEIETKK